MTLLERSKELIKLYYRDGEWNKSPVIRSRGTEIGEEQKRVLFDVFYLFVNSNMLSEQTVGYMLSHSKSMRLFIDSYNESVVEELRWNVNTALSKIQYDSKKIINHLGDKFIEELVGQPEISLDSSKRKVALLYERYFKESEIVKNIRLDIPTDTVSYEISEAEWEECLRVLELFSVKNASADKVLSNKAIGYFNYLTKYSSLSDTDKIRLKKLRDTVM